jgi:hypothetical protein
VSLRHRVYTGTGAHPASYSMHTGGSFHGVKWPGRADHSLQSSTEVKNAWSYTSTPPYVFTAWNSVGLRSSSVMYLSLYVVKSEGMERK